MSTYVIIKETGSYSGFRYKPIAVFTSEEAANEYVDVIEARQKKLDEIAKLQNKWFDDGIVNVVKEVATGEQIDDSEIDKELIEAREWRKQHDEKQAQEDDVVANTFLDWWETGMHENPAWDSTGRIRVDGPIVKSYARRTNDARAWAWVNREMHALQAMRGRT